MYKTGASNVGKAYKQQEILTAPPERIIGYLYQGLETYLLQAKAAIDREDVARCGETISRAQGIVWELLGALDMEQGREVSQNLARLYRFMINRLLDASLKKQHGPIDEVLRVLADLKDGWNEMLHQRRSV